MKIDYRTENPSKEYVKAIKAAKTAKALVKAIEPYKNIADDAYKLALNLSDTGVKEFHKAWIEMGTLTDEKRAIELNALYGDIILPRKLMWSTLTEQKFHAPWGAAYIRCEELGWPWEKKL